MKEITLTENELKQISQLIYLDVLGQNESGEDTKLAKLYDGGLNKITIGDLIDYYTVNPEGIEKIKERFSDIVNGKKEYELYQDLLRELEANKEKNYKEWIISDVESKNTPSESGFVAFTIQPKGMNTKIVAFRGSEPLEDPYYRNDWKNNFTTTYALEARQQADAREYIKALMDKTEQTDQLYITGHSLGGNLALYASFNLTEEFREKLVTVSTFNAPGFNRWVLMKYGLVINELDKDGKISEFRNYYDALVPSLLKNPTKGIYIDSKDSDAGMMKNHSLYLLAFDLTTGGLIRSEQQSRSVLANVIHYITMGFEALPYGTKAGIIEIVFGVWNGHITMGLILFVLASTLLILAANPVSLTAILVIATLIISIVVIVVLTIVVSIILNAVIAFAVDMIVLFLQSLAEFIVWLCDEVVELAINIGNEIAAFLKKMGQSISEFFKNIGSWFSSFFSKKSYKDKILDFKARTQAKKAKFISDIKTTQGKDPVRVQSDTQRKWTAMYLANQGIAQGQKMKANLERLEHLQKIIEGKEGIIAEKVSQVLSNAARVTSDVGRNYSETYVQSQLRQIENDCEQVRKASRQLSERLRSQARGLKYLISKYREVEAKLTRAARTGVYSM